MSYQEKYRKAREAGYSDQEIVEFLGKKDPAFEGKVKKAQEAGYTPEEVLGYFNKAPEPKKFGLEDYVSDFGKQSAQGIGIGGLGTYGDILDLFGLQSEETVPGEEAKYSREFESLQKM